MPAVTSEQNILQGVPISKVVLYNLEDTVRELRKNGDRDTSSYTGMAKYINENILTEPNQKISAMAINRWCRENLEEEDHRDNRLAEDYNVNVYEQTKEMNDYLSEQLEAIEIYVGYLKKDIKNVTDIRAGAKEIKDLLFLGEKLLARRQSILNDIAKMQEKVYSMKNFNDIILLVMESIKSKSPVVHAQVIGELKESPMMSAALQKIKTTDKPKK